MTYYQQQVATLTKQVYSNKSLTNQIISAKDFIHINFYEHITLNKMCRHACISKFHFIRSFKDHYGVTPYQYLKAIRIKKAKTLLKNNIAVKEVCQAVGLESITSFTGVFKKTVGLTPKAFQNSSTKAILKNLSYFQWKIFDNQ